MEILWQDERIMVIDKVAGLVVNRAESVKEETVADWCDQYLKIPKMNLDKFSSYESKVFRMRSGLAHRLDKETSGCMLIGKDPESLVFLLKQFKERTIEKKYTALVHGLLKPSEGTVRLPIGRSRFDKEKWQIRYDGKVAETSWKVVSYFEDKTLVELFPKTGRTHQIRVHMSQIGFPLYSDEKYLGRKLFEEDRKILDRHFLHASSLSFFDMTGNRIEVRSPLPSRLSRLIS